MSLNRPPFFCKCGPMTRTRSLCIHALFKLIDAGGMSARCAGSPGICRPNAPPRPMIFPFSPTPLIPAMCAKVQLEKCQLFGLVDEGSRVISVTSPANWWASKVNNEFQLVSMTARWIIQGNEEVCLVEWAADWAAWTGPNSTFSCSPRTTLHSAQNSCGKCFRIGGNSFAFHSFSLSHCGPFIAESLIIQFDCPADHHWIERLYESTFVEDQTLSPDSKKSLP